MSAVPKKAVKLNHSLTHSQAEYLRQFKNKSVNVYMAKTDLSPIHEVNLLANRKGIAYGAEIIIDLLTRLLTSHMLGCKLRFM